MLLWIQSFKTSKILKTTRGSGLKMPLAASSKRIKKVIIRVVDVDAEPDVETRREGLAQADKTR